MSAVTRLIYVANSGTVATPVFGFSTIDLLPAGVITAPEQIAVYRRPLGSSLNTKLTHITDYTIDSSLKNITLTPGVGLAVGDVIVINRETPIDGRVIDFAGLTYLNATVNNNDSDNLLHLIQEINTEVGIALRRSGDLSQWDAEAIEVANAAPGTSGRSLATVAQVQNLIAGTDTAEVGTAHFFAVTADGVEDRWVLVDFPKGDTSDEKVSVFLDGVQQEPTVDYTYGYDIADGDPHIEFTSVPTNGVRINVRGISGQVQAVIANNTINGNAIINGSVGPEKLGFGSGADKRFLVINTGGVGTARTITSTDISGFDTAVRTNRITDLSSPNVSLNMSAQKIVNLTAGSASTDAVNKGQMDAADAAAISAATAAATSVAGFSMSVQGGLAAPVSGLITTDTTLTNSNDQPIFITASPPSLNTQTLSVRAVGSPDFITLSSSPNGFGGTLMGWVPAGWEYRLTSPGSVSYPCTITTVTKGS